MDGWMGGWSEKTKVIPNSTQLKLKLELSLAILLLYNKYSNNMILLKQ